MRIIILLALTAKFRRRCCSACSGARSPLGSADARASVEHCGSADLRAAALQGFFFAWGCIRRKSGEAFQ